MKQGRKMLTEKSRGRSNEIKAKNKQGAMSEREGMLQRNCQNDDQAAPSSTDEDSNRMM